MSSEYKRKLQKLGCAYNLKPMDGCPDPEETILEGLKYYWKSNDIFFMLYGLLYHRISHLINVDRLIKLLKISDISEDEKLLLYAISCKLENSDKGDFYKISEKYDYKNKKFESLPESEMNSFLIERWGIDNEIKTFGGMVRNIPLEDKKKFFVLDKIYKDNQQLSLRALIGANNKADITYLKTEKIVTTANQAFPILKCAKETAYRLWNEIEDINDLEIIIN